MEWDINLLRGLITVVVMSAFLGICFQVYRSKNRSHFEDAGNLPFAEDKGTKKVGVTSEGRE